MLKLGLPSLTQEGRELPPANTSRGDESLFSQYHVVFGHFLQYQVKESFLREELPLIPALLERMLQLESAQLFRVSPFISGESQEEEISRMDDEKFLCAAPAMLLPRAL